MKHETGGERESERERETVVNYITRRFIIYTLATPCYVLLG